MRKPLPLGGNGCCIPQIGGITLTPLSLQHWQLLSFWRRREGLSKHWICIGVLVMSELRGDSSSGSRRAFRGWERRQNNVLHHHFHNCSWLMKENYGPPLPPYCFKNLTLERWYRGLNHWSPLLLPLPHFLGINNEDNNAPPPMDRRQYPHEDLVLWMDLHQHHTHPTLQTKTIHNIRR